MYAFPRIRFPAGLVAAAEAAGKAPDAFFFTAEVRFTLREGKNQQIRRTCKRSGLRVVSLRRDSMCGGLLSLTAPETPLAEGDCRWLTEDEVGKMRVGLGLASEPENG